jgi:hypothetical protein
MEINEIRHTNYLFLLDRFKQSVWSEEPTFPEYGMLKRFAERLGISQAYISHINTRRKEIGPKLARKFETQLKLPNGWMDALHDSTSPVTPGEQEFVKTVMELYRADPVAAQAAMMNALASKLRSNTN